MEKGIFFSKVIPAIAFGILLFFLFFPQIAIAADPAGTVLIIDNDNDVHFEDDQSVGIFQSVFEDIGYNVTIEESVETSNSTWSDYDIVVWSCGDDRTPLRHETYLFSIVENAKKVEDGLSTGIISEELKDKFKTDGFPISEDAMVTKETDDKWVITVGKRIYFVKREDIGLNIYLYSEYKNMLVDYVTDGGYLILEGGNIAWECRAFTAFAAKVLHIPNEFVYCDVGNLTLSTQHPITTTPNTLPDTIGFTPTYLGVYSGDADAVRILHNATGLYNWSYVNYVGRPVKESIARISYGLIAYDNDADVTNGGQVIYYAFDIDDIDNQSIQRKLIENSENWLRKIHKEDGIITARVTGVVLDPSGTPLESVSVKIVNVSEEVTTNDEGKFIINAPLGNQTLIFEKSGYVSTTRLVTVLKEFPLLSNITATLVPRAESRQIGPEGGTIVEDGVSLTIPEGALDSPVNISITPLLANQTPEAKDFNFIRIKGFDLQPTGLSFNKPVKIGFSVKHLANATMFNFSQGVVFVVADFDWETLSYIKNITSVEVNGATFIASFEIDNFSKLVIYDGIGFGDYVEHGIMIHDPVVTLWCPSSSTCACEGSPGTKRECKPYPITLTEEKVITITCGTSESFGAGAKLELADLPGISANYGITFSKSVINSARSATTKNFCKGPQFEHELECGRVACKVWKKDQNFTFYKRTWTPWSGWGPRKVESEFIISWDFGEQDCYTPGKCDKELQCKLGTEICGPKPSPPF